MNSHYDDGVKKALKLVRVAQIREFGKYHDAHEKFIALIMSECSI